MYDVSAQDVAERMIKSTLLLLYTKATWVHNVIGKTFVDCTELQSWEIPGRQSPIRMVTSHPSVWWPVTHPCGDHARSRLTWLSKANDLAVCHRVHYSTQGQYPLSTTGGQPVLPPSVAQCPRMSDDILGTSWDQSRSMVLYWAIQRSWFARVNALCNLSRKKSRKVAVHFRADFWVGVASRCV